MKIASGRVLDRLCVEERCLGAVFTTFGFDPAFFEDQVLRAVLRLSSDPVEQPQRFYSEALRSLQETPVSVVVDAGQRQSGRRLPYDVLDISKIVFHPKSALLLFEEHARLMVGSGNLTGAGYSQNTELFLTLDLFYGNAADASILSVYEQHLLRFRKLANQTGTQLSLLQEELDRRLGKVKSAKDSPDFALLDSTERPLLPQVSELLPAGSNITRIGMLAPFYERDDEGELDATSVFGAFADQSRQDVHLDVGVSWDNAQVRRESHQVELTAGINQLWCLSSEGENGRELEHLVPKSIGEANLVYLDDHGRRRMWDLEEALEAVEKGDLWKLPKPIAYAPRKAVLTASKNYSSVRLWLHPSARLLDGRPIHRPLHAKLLTISYRIHGVVQTLVMMGSANMSRRALLLEAGANAGNVELAIAFVIEGEVSIADFLPDLVCVPAELLDLNERTFPEPGRNWALTIASVTHDPEKKTLTIAWSEIANELPAWQVSYKQKELARAEAPPTAAIEIEDFVLQPSTAEIVLKVEESEFAVPIIVTDLVGLPVVTVAGGLGLGDLLMLLGRRVGIEGATRRKGGDGAGGDEELDQFFGEGFGPTDVFRAWWAVAEDARDPSLSVLALRLLLEGTLGVGAAWKCILDAVHANTMNRIEGWFYGAELLREFDHVELADAPDKDAKQAILNRFKERLSTDLQGLAPDTQDQKWVGTIRKFYAGASS